MANNGSSPMLRSGTFESAGSSGQAMTVSGAMGKAAILLGLVAVSGGMSWNAVASNPGIAPLLMWGGLIGGFILCLVTTFKKEWSPVTAPIYALFEGAFLGVVSLMYGAAYQGIVFQAVLLTLAVALTMLALYSMRIIQPTQKFVAVVTAATLGIAVFYLVAMVLRMGFHIEVPLIHNSGPFAIGFSLFVVCLAALNLIIDFGMIEQGEQAAAPRYMEWYCGFALLVTLVWLYIEILRLLSKLRDR
jgi:uncharacterized YccA/Bax inhibitor family protein